MNMNEVKVTISLSDLCDLKDAAEAKKMYEDWYENAKKECEVLRKEAADLQGKLNQKEDK